MPDLPTALLASFIALGVAILIFWLVIFKDWGPRG